jgi:membrane protease YdiL (CAAX protease family)
VSASWGVGSTQRLLWALGFGLGSAAEFAVLAIIVALEVGLVVVLGLLVVGKLSLRELGWRSERPGAHIALGLAGGVVCTGIVFALSAALGASPSEVGRTIADYTAAQRLLFVLIGVQAAFVEESLFRGYLQPTLVEKLGPMFGVVFDRARDALDGRGHGLNRGCGHARRRTMRPDDSCVAAGALTRQSHRCGAHPAV